MACCSFAASACTSCSGPCPSHRHPERLCWPCQGVSQCPRRLRSLGWLTLELSTVGRTPYPFLHQRAAQHPEGPAGDARRQVPDPVASSPRRYTDAASGGRLACLRCGRADGDLACAPPSCRFHPFLLDPTLSTTPINKRERYEAKFGGKEKVAAMERVMKEKAKNVGINLCVPFSSPASRMHVDGPSLRADPSSAIPCPFDSDPGRTTVTSLSRPTRCGCLRSPGSRAARSASRT